MITINPVQPSLNNIPTTKTAVEKVDIIDQTEKSNEIIKENDKTNNQNIDTKETRNSDNSKNKDENDLQNMFETLKELTEEFESHNIEVKVSFKFEDGYDSPIIEIVDRENNDIIRQIPSDEFLERLKNLDELKGILFEADV